MLNLRFLLFVVQKLTNLQIIDSSGARKGICISTPPGPTASVGDVILLSLRVVLPGCKLKKGQVVKAVVVSTSKNNLREDGSFFNFGSNSVILINAQNLPIGKRIYGPVSLGLRQSKLLKLLFVSSIVL